MSIWELIALKRGMTAADKGKLSEIDAKAVKGANSDITSLSGLTTALSVGQGGTGGIAATGARSNLGAAANGANSDITALTALTSMSNSGYTQLGSDAPAIKIKKITGTCASAGNNATVTHGLTQSKIIGISGFVNTSNNTLVPHQYNNDTFRWDFYVDASDIIVRTGNAASGISGRPFTILLTHEE
jgi:hypothetical protein